MCNECLKYANKDSGGSSNDFESVITVMVIITMMIIIIVYDYMHDTHKKVTVKSAYITFI